LQYDRYGNSSSCNLPCAGDSSKICGGPGPLSVYNTGKDLLKIKETILMPVTRNVMSVVTTATAYIRCKSSHEYVSFCFFFKNYRELKASLKSANEQ